MNKLTNVAPLVIALSACGGGGGGNGTASSNTVGGTVSGNTGSVTLQNNQGETVTLSTAGNFSFPTALTSGSAYSVSVSSAPPGQVCEVSNGSGTVSASNITNISVSCASGFKVSSSDFSNPYCNLNTFCTHTAGEFQVRNSGSLSQSTFVVGVANTSFKTEMTRFDKSAGFQPGRDSAHLYKVTWSQGSTAQTGLVKVSWDESNSRLAVNTINSVNSYKTSGGRIDDSAIALQGTFKFPATFSLVNPVVEGDVNWC